VRGDVGCRGARLGGGGGPIDGCLSPLKGGATPNFGLVSESSSIGVLGGLGGGGGPGLATLDVALGLFGRLDAGTLANLPAPARGGGALNWNPWRGGGEGVLSGDCEGDFGRCGEDVDWLSGRLLRDGGGAGAGPLLEDPELPVFWGLIALIELRRPLGGAGGGGGGALPLRLSFAAPSLLPPIGSPLAFRCSM